MVAAAAGLLAEGGFDAVRHRAVAERAGLPLASTTYYFSSIDELVAAAIEYGAAVEIGECRQALPVRIVAQQPSLQSRPRGALGAAHADHPIDAAMQVDDPSAAGGLVQAVDILGDQDFDLGGLLDGVFGGSAAPKAPGSGTSISSIWKASSTTDDAGGPLPRPSAFARRTIDKMCRASRNQFMNVSPEELEPWNSLRHSHHRGRS